MITKPERERMTSSERTELSKVVRIRARLAKKEINLLVSKLLAKFEQQLAADFSAHHKRFEDVTQEARKLIERADAEIAKRSELMGIPDAFRPSLSLAWRGRGENAYKERRKELRAVAETELEQRAQDAKLAIDRSEAQTLTEIVREGLTTEVAKDLLRCSYQNSNSVCRCALLLVRTMTGGMTMISMIEF